MGAGRAVVGRVRRRGAGIRHFTERIRSAGGENGRQRVVAVGQSDLGWKTDGKIVGDQVNQMSQVSGGRGDLDWRGA